MTKENAELKKELESYKALDSHYDEIEEDAKRIAEENEQLKAEIANYEETVDRLYEDQKYFLDKLNLQNQRLNELKKENAEQKKQIDQLSNDNHVLKTSFITQQEQIEKMRNCSNCNGIKPNGMRSEKCDFCFKGKDFINWELAE